MSERSKLILKTALPFALAAALAVILLVPGLQTTVLSWFGVDTGGTSSVYADFNDFIPYTMGYFPDDFTITSVGTGAVKRPDFDQFQEWYASDTYFILLIESQGADVSLPSGEEITIKDAPAVLMENPDLDALDVEFEDYDRYDISETYLIAFFRDEILLEVVTNLPREEAVKVADLLIPSQCTSKPTEAP